jgi:hypothetical protein
LQADHSIERTAREEFWFYPNLFLFVHLNTRIVLSNTTTGCYFSQVYSKAFHNLTTSKSIPFTAHYVLGLGLNFVPVPERITTNRDTTTSAKQGINQIHFKKSWVGQKTDVKPFAKLRMRSI